MPRNYDTTGHKLFPRVPEIRIFYPPDGTPRVKYLECTALVDGDGKVRHTDAGASEHIIDLEKITEPVQCVRPDTGEPIQGMAVTRGQLMLSLLAFIRADQKRRDSEA
jgi:hypothetical protein